MIPVIAIVGRPNVGKSTLFNRITGTRDALVDDQPGVTRDRLHGPFTHDGRRAVIVDTGGVDEADTELQTRINEQVDQILNECDRIIMLVDGLDGLAPGDRDLAERVRRAKSPVTLVVNKAEGQSPQSVIAEFHALGLGEPLAVSALRGDGVSRLLDNLVADVDSGLEAEADRITTRVAVIGRPNVGKSTLINILAGENRVIVLDRPGTTRDSVNVPLTRNGRDYLFMDTAGVRRKSRVTDRLESFSVVKTLRALESCHVAVLMLDAREGVIDQDATLAGMISQSGRAVVIAANKWDGLEPRKKNYFRRELSRKLPFLPEYDCAFISALHGSGVGELVAMVDRAEQSAFADLSTSRLNRVLRSALSVQSPPLRGNSPTRLKFAHQGGRNPPRVIIHGNQVDKIPETYRRYLANTFAHAFKLTGVRLQIEFRKSDNPYDRRLAGR